MEVVVKDSYEAMSRLAGEIIGDLIRRKPRAVIGLATGSTPVGAYKELIRLHREEGLDFGQVVTFNLDEYVGLPPGHDQSYRYFMDANLFNHINIRKENTFVPDGMALDLAAFCKAYDQRIRDYGGMDLQLLGIGSNGHIAFNEPGSSLGSRTRIKTLTEETRRDNARFFKSIGEVPRYVLTMGIGTIMEARQIVMLANKDSKAEALAAAVEGPITAMCPASILQMHPSVTVIADKAAGARLGGNYPDQPARLILEK